jgi:hypothetical protein
MSVRTATPNFAADWNVALGQHHFTHLKVDGQVQRTSQLEVPKYSRHQHPGLISLLLISIFFGLCVCQKNSIC